MTDSPWSVRQRRGGALPELIVALVLIGILGAAAVRGFVSQTRVADEQWKRRSARGVARAPINLMLAELRMVASDFGVVAASAASGASSVTARIPVSVGLVCGASGAGTAVSLLPTDSVLLAQAALSGHAYRTNAGTYAFTDAALSVTSGGAAVCTAASITTVAGGNVVVVTPALAAPATAGTPVLLYQRVTYGFAPSTSMSGRRALFRTLESSGVSEEIAAPYDTASRIRFFRDDNDTSDVAVPPLAQITGVELVLIGASERPRAGRTTPETAALRAGIYFANRP